MLEKEHVKRALDAALETGGDYAELFFEDTSRNSVDYRDGKVESALSGHDHGAGIRVLYGNQYSYAYTSDTSKDALMDTAKAVAATLTGVRKKEIENGFTVKPRIDMQMATKPLSGADTDKRVAVAKEAYSAAKSYSDEISQANVSVVDNIQNVIIANAEGMWVEDRRVRSRLYVTAVAATENEMQTGTAGPGAGRGYEFFEELDIEKEAKSAAKTAVTMLHAPYAPAGRMQVAIDGAFGGVIFHEACGHSLEATSVAKNLSEFSNKLNQQIATPVVTAIDDGTIPLAWGSLGYDDEGTQTRKNVLIEEGVLKGYMIDILGGRRMGMQPTGNARRQNYRFAPTSRMTNTYIAGGQDEEIIKNMGDGLYAAKMGGGSVNPVTGEFNFVVLEGYLVKDGKIQSPVRGATLIGKGSEVLQHIQKVERAHTFGEGVCGSVSGNVPTCVGQPMILVSDMLVGGREG